MQNQDKTGPSLKGTIIVGISVLLALLLLVPKLGFAQQNKKVLVVCRVGAVASQIGMSKAELSDKLDAIGDLIDVPHSISSGAELRDYIFKKSGYLKSISAIQLVGSWDTIEPFECRIRVSPSEYEPLYSDDVYADINSDGMPDVPIARIPTCAPKPGEYGDIFSQQYERVQQAGVDEENYLVSINQGDLFIEKANLLARSIKAERNHYRSLPYSSQEKQVPFNNASGIIGFSLHGGQDDGTSYSGETVVNGDSQYPNVVTIKDDSFFKGLVFASCCYSGLLQSRSEFRNPSTLYALAVLDNGAQGFIGSTGLVTVGTDDGLLAMDDVANKVYEAVQKNNDSLRGFYSAKKVMWRALNKYNNPHTARNLIQTVYYGIVPVSYWDSPVLPPPDRSSSMAATSLVLDVSDSMNEPGLQDNATKIDQARTAATAVVNMLKGIKSQGSGGVRLGVISFSDAAQEELELTDNYEIAESTINTVETRAMTNILDAILAGNRQLEGIVGQKVMIILSDGRDTMGNDRDSIIEAASAAADANTKIFTIGFGSEGSIDEHLLEEIAGLTGGAYQFADASNPIEIVSTFIKAQASSSSEILFEDTGAVSQGETVKSGSFKLNNQADIQAVLYWPGSKLEIRLKDPEGVIVDEAYPGYSIVDNQIPSQVFVKNAMAGEWSISVFGAEVSMLEEPYYTLVSQTEAESSETPKMMSSEATSATIASAVGGSSGGGYIIVFGVLFGVLVAVVLRPRNSHGDSDSYSVIDTES